MLMWYPARSNNSIVAFCRLPAGMPNFSVFSDIVMHSLHQALELPRVAEPPASRFNCAACTPGLGQTRALPRSPPRACRARGGERNNSDILRDKQRRQSGGL